MKTAKPKLQFARRLRRDATDAKQRLWYHLRNRRLAGLKFRRQVPVGPYIVDLMCRERQLIIELDGDQHAVQEEYDNERSRYLHNAGFKVLCFWNNQVLFETEGVLETILNDCDSQNS